MPTVRLSTTALVCAVLMVAGCATTAGPFVTNISSDGQGGLVIEKAMVEYSQWSEGISTKNHTTSTICIGYPAAQPPEALGAPLHQPDAGRIGWESRHTGMVFRLTSTDPQRKPFLRVDLSLNYSSEDKPEPDATGQRGAELERDALRRALGALPPVETLEIDQAAARESAADAIRQAFERIELPVPTEIRFSSFVIQG